MADSLIAGVEVDEVYEVSLPVSPQRVSLDAENATEIEPQATTSQQDQEDLSLRERIVEMMPEYPCLWCTTLRSYKDLTKKSAAWRELSCRLNASGKT